MTNRRVLIIGGGIGGPVAAIAPQRAGIEAILYEAADAPADYAGLFLNISSDGLDVLHTLDIDAARQTEGVRIPRTVMWSGTGRRLGEVANGIRLQDGTVSAAVRRGLLQRVLREEAERRGVKVEFGKRLDGFLAGADTEVVARFADGTEAEGSVLVGADGIHSATRQAMDPAAPRPTYTGLLSLGGYSHGTAIPPTPDTQHLVFGRRAFFGYLVPSSGEIWWFVNLPRVDEPSRAELAGTTSETWKRRLLDLFAGDLDRISEIIGATHSEIGAYTVHDLRTIPTWHRGPVVLLGDAAHATSPNAGQGASLAMEDGLVLAKCLRDLPDVTQALAAYERLRRERAE
jgi:FAD-dependent urate hydroxylase